jgi:hypothetical protein
MTPVLLGGGSSTASREPMPNFRSVGPGLVVAGRVALAASRLAGHYAF